MTVKHSAAAAAPIESCCTCATRLSDVPRYTDSEKLLPHDRWLECCPRVICGKCIHTNSRFETYCPFCQISITSNLLPPGLKEPPSYESATSSSAEPIIQDAKFSPMDRNPPPYTPITRTSTLEKPSLPLPAQDTLHFLTPNDSITSLSLAYAVPATVLRRHNNLPSDHLLPARRTVLIPGSHYPDGKSLSPRPVEGEEEEARKAKVRRWMVACKVHEYDVAVLYLEQANYDLAAATEAYFADEEWEKRHPVEDRSGRGKEITGGTGSAGANWMKSVPRRR
ncbi:hypothetical protein F5Y15DRAFT_244937 [Xylariaceae sp. FL0016]|nr:hypothetical protein F5Y15DRAFT_244937 [Xylariaceae sp. FL0016]